MSTVKRITDLTKYTTVLPYASELFGVYQPLLGWKSKRLEKRFDKGLRRDKNKILSSLTNQFKANVNLIMDNKELTIDIKPGVLKEKFLRNNESIIMEKIGIELNNSQERGNAKWDKIINSNSIRSLLKNDVTKYYTNLNSKNLLKYTRDRKEINLEDSATEVIKNRLGYESAVAGSLLYLVGNKKYNVLDDLFFNSINKTEQTDILVSLISNQKTTEAFLDIENLDPTEKSQLQNVSLSPISVVHLFRQYFFELDTFLGTPESHVWLSPGAKVTLIEEQSRKRIEEKTIENTYDFLTKTESSETIKDEISEAVKDENSKKLNLGASVTAKYTNISATASFDYESSQNTAREKTHTSMREQSQKLSSEIRKNFKSTFKIVEEISEFSSTMHVLKNKTNNLINYELRRKMRQVGVQVQDIGTYLCWQTYVDDPGRDLGLSKLMHIAKSPDLDSLPHPEQIPRLQTSKETRSVTIPFIATNDEGADRDEVYVNGKESDGNNEGIFGTSGDFETIEANFPLNFVAPHPNHELTLVEFDPLGKPVTVSILKGDINNKDGKAEFTLHLDTVNFEGNNSIQINLTLYWEPNSDANKAIDEMNATNLANFKEQEKAAYESAYIETIRERIDAISNITPRREEDLREEERIVIYRRLIQDMLLNKVSAPDDKTRHVLAELINSIFDVDKMLYFVAPEYWRPRLHRSKQQLYNQKKDKSKFKRTSITSNKHLYSKEYNAKFIDEVVININDNKPDQNDDPTEFNENSLTSNVVGWGDVDNENRDSYYITEDSTPAKFGSSLGWLLQFDGDNRRNAFLNSPWVKAVMPIRPGKEKAAINWLKAVEGMNGITDADIYQTNNPNEKDINGNPLNGQKMLDVLMDLAKKIEKKHKESLEKDQFPKQSEVANPNLIDNDNTVTSTPIDRVYEHGFFPLENSFRANIGENYEIFDQWIEILPTDQTVPVEVEYDPISGRQV